MLLSGFDTFDWISSGYWFEIDEGNVLVPSVEPQILPRPGTYATFGVSQVGAMNIVGGFGYSGTLTPEAAFSNLFKRLNPANTTPRQLRAQRDDGVLLKIQAILAVPNYASNKFINFKDASFICVQPFFLATGFTTGTGGFV
jgi:hypothetical protein